MAETAGYESDALILWLQDYMFSVWGWDRGKTCSSVILQGSFLSILSPIPNSPQSPRPIANTSDDWSKNMVWNMPHATWATALL